MIRRFQDEDAEAVAALDGELFPDVCWNSFTVAREAKLGWALVAQEGNEIVGFLLARFDNNLTDIIRIGVCTPWQGRGIGRALLKHAIEKVASTIMLTVRQANHRAMKLYLSEGFKPISMANDSVILLREEC